MKFHLAQTHFSSPEKPFESPFNICSFIKYLSAPETVFHFIAAFIIPIRIISLGLQIKMEIEKSERNYYF